MRPVEFDYVAPDSLEAAVSALVEAGDEAKLLAGGQSLLPVLRMRMADPAVLIDVGRIDALREVREDGDDLVIGAMVTHHAVASDPRILQDAAVLAEAAAAIGDPQIRYRGTIGGALAHADPAGDVGPAVLALDATLEIQGPGGPRSVPAAEFFDDYFTTALGEDEILAAVRVPKHSGWGMSYQKFTQVAQSWSIVAVAVALRIEGGTVAEARVAMANMGSTPLRARATEEALVGTRADAAALKAAAAGAGDGTEPPVDPAGTAEYRRHLAGVLAGRGAVAAAGLG